MGGAVPGAIKKSAGLPAIFSATPVQRAFSALNPASQAAWCRCHVVGCRAYALPSLLFPALFRNPAGRGKEKPFEKGSFLPPCTPHPFPKLFMFAFPFCVPQKEKAGQKFGKNWGTW